MGEQEGEQDTGEEELPDESAENPMQAIVDQQGEPELSMAGLAEGIGAIPILAGKYEADELNELVNELTGYLQSRGKRRFYLKALTLALAVLLIISIFIGTAWLVTQGHMSGQTIALLIGTIVGYLARLSSEMM